MLLKPSKTRYQHRILVRELPLTLVVANATVAAQVVATRADAAPPVLGAELVVALARVGTSAAGVLGDTFPIAEEGADPADTLLPHAFHAVGAPAPANAACRFANS